MSIEAEWIDHDGSGCPVEAGTPVDVMDADGNEWAGVSALNDHDACVRYWIHNCSPSDAIIKYRIHNAFKDAPDEATHLLTTGPEWDGNKEYISRLVFAEKVRNQYIGLQDFNGHVMEMALDAWQVIATRKRDDVNIPWDEMPVWANCYIQVLFPSDQERSGWYYDGSNGFINPAIDSLFLHSAEESGDIEVYYPSMAIPINESMKQVERGEYTGGSEVTAHNTVQAALKHMQDRASTYDKPSGERSMSATVEAFNAISGHRLTEEQGWMFMALLKIVRSQQGDFKADNYEDLAAYAGLMAESGAVSRIADQEKNK